MHPKEQTTIYQCTLRYNIKMWTIFNIQQLLYNFFLEIHNTFLFQTVKYIWTSSA